MIAFKLNPRSGVPYYRQIIDQIRFGIATGKLDLGDQLPTVRALAVELRVNLNTVSKAYKELEIQNILETQQGTGTFIGPVPVRIPEDESRSKLMDIYKEFVAIAASYGFSQDDIIRVIETEGG